MSDPSTIASLAARWVASDLALANGASVPSWAPRTGAGTLTASGTAQPTYQTSGLVGSKPCVRFNGSSTAMTTSSATGLGTAQTIALILYPSDWATQQEIVQWGVMEGLVGSTSGKFDLYAGSADIIQTTSNSTTAPHIVLYMADSTTSDKVYVDGTLGVTGSAGNPSSSGTLRVGNWNGGGRFFNGDIAEILAFTTALSSTDRSTVDSYAQDTYGVTVSDYVSSGINYTKSPADPEPLHDSATVVKNVVQTKADVSALHDSVNAGYLKTASRADPASITSATTKAVGKGKADVSALHDSVVAAKQQADYLPCTATLASNGVSTAVLASNGVSTAAIIPAEVLGTATVIAAGFGTATVQTS